MRNREFGLESQFLAVVLALSAPTSCFAAEKGFMLKDGETVVFLGDSITQAATKTEGYITLFKLACDVTGHQIKVINAGISGHKSNDMLARLQKDVIDRHPTWVSISCGVNDVWHGKRGVPLPDYKKNMTEMVARCQAAGIRLLLLTATPIYENPKSNENQKLAPYNDFLRQLAREKKVAICDLNRAFMSLYVKKRANRNVWTTDGVHMKPRRGRGSWPAKSFALSARHGVRSTALSGGGSGGQIGENIPCLGQAPPDFLLSEHSSRQARCPFFPLNNTPIGAFISEGWGGGAGDAS